MFIVVADLILGGAAGKGRGGEGGKQQPFWNLAYISTTRPGYL